MIIEFHNNFKKSYKKLRQTYRQKCDERVALFAIDPFNPVLNNHLLSGEYKEYRSINITGDLRALYQPISKNKAFFIIVDTHSNLFG